MDATPCEWIARQIRAAIDLSWGPEVEAELWALARSWRLTH